MAKKTQERSTKVAPWIGAGILSASLLKSTIDRIAENKVTGAAKNATKNATHNAKHLVNQTTGNVQSFIEDLPLSQLQIDKLASVITDRVGGLSGQVQGVAGRITGKPVVVKKAPSYRAWWMAGIGLGFATAGLTAFFVTRRRMNKQQEEELVALPQPSSNGHQNPANRLRSAVGNIIQRSPASSTSTSAAPAASASATATLTTTPHETADASKAKFVGNIRTMIFHPADSDHLPAEENRIYFPTETDATEAGYRLAEGE